MSKAARRFMIMVEFFAHVNEPSMTSGSSSSVHKLISTPRPENYLSFCCLNFDCAPLEIFELTTIADMQLIYTEISSQKTLFSRQTKQESSMDRVVAAALVLFFAVMSTRARALTSDYYDMTCPSVFSIVQQEVQAAVADEKRMAASLVRLHFHDCFVNGCDGSLLLDNSTDFETEKDAPANLDSARGFEVIDKIKAALEAACPNTVSCADILAIASRDSAVEVGLTNSYTVLLGRLDSLTASKFQANASLPAPNMNHAALVDNFGKVGLNETDLVALSGAHTIGRVNCTLLLRFALNNVDINSDFKANIEQACNANITGLQNLDLTTPDNFDNSYYSNLLKSEGILISDQTLFSTAGAASVAVVQNFASNQDAFFSQFALSTIKMGNIMPPAGQQGEIRTNCRVVNSASSAKLIAYE
ncbi:hypothetical protein M758_4G038800 [Ceratodon purpureus]|uniref:Peroxidase n=1 Tax=Ceratodon purpureus TaxID=3225 RepID=A0A8T0I7M0_CERPU|nr:hypothetical protein KC19_4G042000 [Ceratodon purpureus]KAG0618097.1 hypothetical protein M758_4G038800 [Ceratodon purpureus]